MKVSEQWLRQWVSPSISTQDIADRLTMAGLEVDAIEPAAAAFHSVVVGKIESIEPHPDAKKLRVCQVSDGKTSSQVVCGASNAAEGLRVPFAKLGAELPGGVVIKAAELRGVASAGMLCGASELGLEDIVDGLLVLPEDAPLGADVRELLSLDDAVIEVDLTPNRSDCLSMKGIARELGVLCQQDVTYQEIYPVSATVDDTFSIEISAPAACPHYMGRVIKGISRDADTPLWMREALRRAGIRSIDPVVDITNYVMLEIGQPMHAFDLNKLSTGIEVRMAKQGELLTLLDGNEVKLDSDMLVIADQQRCLALAGVMGGEYAAVESDTHNLFLEAAFFAPEAIAGRARRLGLHTDSSHRFERGVDYALANDAIERATQLLLDIVGGEIGPVLEVKTDNVPAAKSITLRQAQIKRLLGFSLPDQRVEDILERLGLSPKRLNTDSSNEQSWQLRVPSYRFDLAIEADILEELARIYGYDELPVMSLSADLSFSETPESALPLSTVKQSLVARGFQEVISYSFIDPSLADVMDDSVSAVSLKNPISSDMAVMRTSLLPGLVATARYNLNRQQSRLRLFETGLRFIESDGKLQQEPMLAGLMSGTRSPVGWNQDGSLIDFYDLKAEVEGLFQQLGGHSVLEELDWVKASHMALHPGQSADIVRNGEIIGKIGQLHPRVQQILDIDQAIYLFELPQNLISIKKVPKFKELSKFPEVKRDLAFIASLETTAGEIVNCIREISGEHLIDLAIFDRYQGERVDSDKQSIGVSLTWQHAKRTLEEKEVNQLTNNVVSELAERLKLSLRS